MMIPYKLNSLHVVSLVGVIYIKVLTPKKTNKGLVDGYLFK